jgi:hypothetical protein
MKKLIALFLIAGVLSTASVASAFGNNWQPDHRIKAEGKIKFSENINGKNFEGKRLEVLNKRNFHRNGNIHFVGIISSISGSTLTLQNQGSWVLDMSAAVFDKNGTTTIFSFQAGDRILISGSASSTTNTINVKTVKFLENNQEKSVKKSGTVSNVTSTGFTLNSGNNSYLVDVNGSTTFALKNSNGTSTSFTFRNLAEGMKVKVKGILNKLTSVITGSEIKVKTTSTINR